MDYERLYKSHYMNWHAKEPFARELHELQNKIMVFLVGRGEVSFFKRKPPRIYSFPTRFPYCDFPRLVTGITRRTSVSETR